MKRCAPVVFLVYFFLTAFQAAETQEVYKRMFDDPLTFTGPEGDTVDPSTLKDIPIGLFAPSDESQPAAHAVYRGALLAVEQANIDGGYRGVPFRLVRRWARDPWAAGSKEMINLVYRDNVWAVIAFKDGADHIAQQIAAKAHIPVIAPISSVPSLTRTRVPWIFRLPPDDKVQARLLVKNRITNEHLKRVGIISGTGHACRAAGKEITDEMTRHRVPPVFHFNIPPDVPDIRTVVERIRDFRPDGLVLCLQPPVMRKLLKAMQRNGVRCPVSMPWVPGVELKELQTLYKGSLFMVEPFSRTDPLYQTVNRDFKKRFGVLPTYSAVYAYNAAQMIIRSIRSNGLNRPAIRRGIPVAEKSATKAPGHEGKNFIFTMTAMLKGG